MSLHQCRSPSSHPPPRQADEHSSACRPVFIIDTILRARSCSYKPDHPGRFVIAFSTPFPIIYMTTQHPIGHHRADRNLMCASHCGQLSMLTVRSSFRSVQLSRKHLVFPLETRCLHLYSTTVCVHMMKALAIVQCRPPVCSVRGVQMRRVTRVPRCFKTDTRSRDYSFEGRLAQDLVSCASWQRKIMVVEGR